MKRSVTIMILLFFGLGLCNQLYASRYIESRDTKKSPYYTGESSGSNTEYTTTQSWLNAKKSDMGSIALRYKGFIVEDKELEQYVLSISNKLLQQWPGSTPDIHFYILAQSSPILYSAETSAANEIILANGVLIQAASVDEIAAVIAHEVSHILLEHNKEISYKKTANLFLDDAAGFYGLYKTVDAVEYNKQTQQLETVKDTKDDMLDIAKQQIIAKKLYATSHATLFSRSAEYEADKLGLDLLMASGYSPHGLKVSLERMSHSYSLASDLSQQLRNVGAALMEQQSTQLTSMARQGKEKDEIEDAMKNLAQDLQKKATNQGINTLFNFISSSHPVPEKRVESITEYIFENYSRKERRRQLNTDAINSLRTGRIGELLRNLEAANNGLELISRGQLNEAAPLAIQSISSPSSNSAYNRFVAFRLRDLQGNNSSALKNLDRYNKTSWVPIEESLLMADSFLAANRPKQAQALITSNEDYFGTLDNYYPMKIRIAKHQKDDGRVSALGFECAQTVKKPKELIDRCVSLSGIDYDQKSAASKMFSSLKELTKKIPGMEE